MNKRKIEITTKRLCVGTWRIIDVAVVYLLILGCSFIIYAISQIILENEKKSMYLIRYFYATSGIFLPIMWIKWKYNLNREALGLTKRSLSVFHIIFIGFLTFFLGSLLFLVFFPYQSLSYGNEGINSYYLLFLPLSLSGFATLVLSPISEEILDRGFMYGYLRGKIGVPLGLTLQALLFSLLHFNYFNGNMGYLLVSRFFMGLILGSLYEKTGSLYPAMVCHSMFNYFAIIFRHI